MNQINPWLSACDLAGPAPADLQGSCGPPEVPKYCPVACVASSKGNGGNGNDAEFVEVIEKVRVTGRNCYWSTGGKKEATTETAVAESERFDSSSIKSSGTDGGEVTSDKKGRTDREKAEGVRMDPEQCLFYLEESHKRDICRDDFGRTSTRSFLTPRENRYWFMSGLRLRHCCDHVVVNALAPGKGGPLENVLNGGQKCVDALDKLLHADVLAARLHCEFEEVLARYDCAQSYSVIFNCTHCKEAYRKWVCSSLVPYFAHGEPQDLNSSNNWAGSRLRPCRSFCQSVEQRCPYLLPGDRAPAYPTQYAGEPTFLCRDPNIPETGEQAARALHSSEENECCFHACSEELPGSGICANCTNKEPRRRGNNHDPPTAPRCEINPIRPASTGGGYEESGFTDSSLEREQRHDSSTYSAAASISSTGRQQGTLVCGTGDGVDSIASVSSSDRSATSILPQLIWLCSVLTSILGNVRTIPVLWIAKILLWPIVPLHGNEGSDGRDHRANLWDSVSKSKKRNGLIDIVVWLRRCFRRDYVGARDGANRLLEKWLVIERKCRSRWCRCWYWWWWRWRGISSACGRVQWKFRSRRPRGKSRFGRFVDTRYPSTTGATLTRIVATATATATTIATAIATTIVVTFPTAVVTIIPTTTTTTVVKNESFFHLRKTYRDSLYERWSQRFLVDSFTVKCLWRRWCWRWWWLHRWWRSRETHYGGFVGMGISLERKDRIRGFRRDRDEAANRKRKKRRRGVRRRRRRKMRRRGREALEISERWTRSSSAGRRHLKLFSRKKDPP